MSQERTLNHILTGRKYDLTNFSESTMVYKAVTHPYEGEYSNIPVVEEETKRAFTGIIIDEGSLVWGDSVTLDNDSIEYLITSVSRYPDKTMRIMGYEDSKPPRNQLAPTPAELRVRALRSKEDLPEDSLDLSRELYE